MPAAPQTDLCLIENARPSATSWRGGRAASGARADDRYQDHRHQRRIPIAWITRKEQYEVGPRSASTDHADVLPEWRPRSRRRQSRPRAHSAGAHRRRHPLEHCARAPAKYFAAAGKMTPEGPQASSKSPTGIRPMQSSRRSSAASTRVKSCSLSSGGSAGAVSGGDEYDGRGTWLSIPATYSASWPSTGAPITSSPR